MLSSPEQRTGDTDRNLHIVVRGANWVGDAVMSIPALKELRRIFPEARITAWGPDSLEGLMRLCGVFDDFVGFGERHGGVLTRPFRMIPALRAGNHRLCVFLQNAFESALTAALARIPVRAGYPTDLRGPLLTHRIPFPAGVFEAHQVFYYLGITDYLSARYDGAHPRTTEPDCTAVIPEEYLLRARRLLSREGCDGDRFMCFCPGSVNSEAKRWPAESFARLAESVAENLGLAAVFLGAPGERALINGIQAQMRTRAANLAGHADIPTSMAVMRLSALTVSNDTGSAHLAAAAGAKVLTIFGPTKAGITAPWGKNVRLIQGQAPCAPCRHFTCPKPIHECMVSITPEAVLSECARMPAHE